MGIGRSWFLVSGFLFSVSCAPALPAATQPKPLAPPPAAVTAKPIDLKQLEIPHTKFVLNNGLTVVVHEDHTTPAVTVNRWYHGASLHEDPGKTGLAPLHEHVFLPGSAT